MSAPLMRLTITLKDGRKISGVYGWLSAMARLDYARNQMAFKSFTLGEVKDGEKE